MLPFPCCDTNHFSPGFSNNLSPAERSRYSGVMFGRYAAVTILCLGLASRAFAQEEDSAEEHDSLAGLPRDYASKYLVASATLSPDQKMAVIYPKEDEDEKGKNLLVVLKPFQTLTALETKTPYFAHQSHGGIRAQWSKDNAVALVTLESKWGPGDVFLFEFREGKLERSTNLLGKIREELQPDYQKVKPEPYNDSIDFIFDDDMVGGGEGELSQQCMLDEAGQVRVKAAATTDPKHIGGIKAWEAKFDGVWDIAQARFISAKVTRKFGGVRKDD